MCLINHLKELIDAGITSFKIEGRMKSAYYVATVTNAYRHAFDAILSGETDNFDYVKELEKTSHRLFTTGFYFGDTNKTNLESSAPVQTHEFMAVVLNDATNGKVLIEMRNKFKVGDTLEVLSPNDTFNKTFVVENLTDEEGNAVEIAMKVKQKLFVKTNLPLKQNDILRKNIEE